MHLFFIPNTNSHSDMPLPKIQENPVKFSLPSVQSLLEKAAEQAAFSCSDKEVVYCYLTLRPIAIGLSGMMHI